MGDIFGDDSGFGIAGFQINWAFLDTGVSSILLSKETATYLDIEIDPNGQYVDPGVSGEEYFDISEPLYIGITDYNDPNPEDQSHYQLNGPYRIMIRQHNAEGLLAEPIDLLGMPVMFGKTVVFNTRAPSSLEYFTAQIKEPNDPSIPKIDFEVSLRFEKYVMPLDPNYIPPLPVLAYNPVIDNIVIEYDGNSVTIHGISLIAGGKDTPGEWGITDPGSFVDPRGYSLYEIYSIRAHHNR